jgi:cyclohexanone monooxygenase
VKKNEGRGASDKNEISDDAKTAVRERYAFERTRRLRADGNDQYLHLDNETSHFLDDPYVDRAAARAPILREVTTAIIGGGFGGMMCGARLSEAGVDDFLIIDKAGDFGGTWYWNRYPGAACDVESYIYMPLLEELNYIPTEKYARAYEIREHCQRIGRAYRLYDRALFQTEVKGVSWDQDSSRWIIETDQQDRISAQFICMAAGPLQRPKLPNIPGISSFGGKAFHTSRWDYEYTGGNERGELRNLHDKVVGIIGTGATAVQAIPFLARAAKHLYVFQRTPSTVAPRNNRPTPPDFADNLQPGWQQARRDNFTRIVCGLDEDTDLVADGWTEILPPMLGFASPERREQRAAELGGYDRLTEEIDNFDTLQVMQLHRRIDDFVDDPDVAEALKPYYKVACKRPCFHDEFLPVFNEPNVTLVDTEGRGVEAINTTGLIAKGRQFDLDCLIFATGFEWGANYTEKAGYDVLGRNGASLGQKWANGPITLHGTYTSGFPNCFVLTHIQAAVTPSFTHVADEQAKHFADIISDFLKRNIAHFDVTEAAEIAYTDEVERLAEPRLQYDATCTPSYQNHEGRMDRALARNGPHGGGVLEYLERIKSWRLSGSYRGLLLTERPRSVR